jgi:uncharacterized UPF0146 family protein
MSFVTRVTIFDKSCGIVEEFKILAEYIARHYPDAKKIVEVGVGKIPDAAVELSRLLPSCEVIVTDIAQPPELPSKIKFLRDDITNPNLQVYQGASLIYAIRPPPELNPYLLKVARAVNADLIIKLTSDEAPPKGARLINYRGLALYSFKLRE